jgi:hypothetical protein
MRSAFEQAETLFSFLSEALSIRSAASAISRRGATSSAGYGAADRPARYLFATSRIIHAYTIAHLIGRRPRTQLLIMESIFCRMTTATPSREGAWNVGYDGTSDRPNGRTITPSFSWPRRVCQGRRPPGADRLNTDIFNTRT